MESTVADAPSTVTLPNPQVTPEAKASTAESAPPKKVSMADAIKAKLEEARKKTASTESKEGNPSTLPEKTEETTSQTEETSSDTPTQGEYIDTVAIDGKPVPVADVLDRLDIEVYANGKMYPVETFQKLLDHASMGIAAAERVHTAKQVIREANEAVSKVKADYESRIQKEVPQKVNSYLTDLLDKVTNGKINPGTGKPFQSQGERTGAVALTKELIEANRGSGNLNQALNPDDIQKLVDARFEQESRKLKEQQETQAKQSLAAQIGKTARNSLVEATKPYMQYFNGLDGKFNSETFGDFVKAIQEKADTFYNEAKQPTDETKIKDFVSKATKLKWETWKGILRVNQSEKLAVPVGGRGSGIPTSSAPQKTYSNPQEALRAKIREQVKQMNTK